MKRERDNESRNRANGTAHSEFAPMAKLPVCTWIGNAFAALLGKHGAVTAQAEAAGCSRQTVYDHAAKVEHVVTEAQLPGPSRAELLEENRCLRAENQDLRRQLAQARPHAADALPFDRGQRLRLAVVTWAMGLSLNQIEDIFRILLGGAAQAPDRATLGRWVLAGARQAGTVLAVLDEHARALVRQLCLDEIFLHRQAVLMAVEPFSMAWLLGQRSGDRTGVTWCQALRPFDSLEFAQADQGSGLQKGLRLAAEQRRQALARAPADARPKALLTSGLDVFHIAQAARVPLRARWRRVQKAFTAYEVARAALAKANERRPRAVGGRTRRLQAAWQKVEWYWSWYEEQEKAWGRARAALELFRPDGRLNDRAWARQEIQAACAALKGPAWKKVRGLLTDPRALAFLDRTHQELATAEPRAEVREALVRWWRLENRPGAAAFPAAVVVARAVCARLARDWAAAYARVSAVLGQVLRASSAVECLNSVVRMQQARHRNLSQEMLDLKRLYWNCRPFRDGQRAKKCPYQHLGVALPTYDFWGLLGTDPDELRQKLSTQAVAA
jgi:hypothetical protein